MKRTGLLLTMLVCASIAIAQGSRVNGLITTGTTCATAGACVSAVVPLGNSGAQIQLVSNSFSGTVTFETTVDGSTWVPITATPVPSGSTVTTATGSGVWTFHVAALGQIRVRASTFNSGQLRVWIATSTGAP